MPALWVSLTFLLASFIHTTAGFGAALVAMAVLVPLIGFTTAAPLVAAVVLTLQMLIVYRYLNMLDFGAVKHLLLALVIGIPIGIWGSAWLSEDVLLTALGVFILAYVLYNVSGANVRLDQRKRWAAGFGVLSGIFSGAYNSGGPLIVMYLQARGYPPDTFRANLQTAFITGTMLVISGHVLRGTFTEVVIEYYLLSLPAVILGFAVGFLLAQRIQPVIFRRMVLALLAVLGLQLLLR